MKTTTFSPRDVMLQFFMFHTPRRFLMHFRWRSPEIYQELQVQHNRKTSEFVKKYRIQAVVMRISNLCSNAAISCRKRAPKTKKKEKKKEKISQSVDILENLFHRNCFALKLWFAPKKHGPWKRFKNAAKLRQKHHHLEVFQKYHKLCEKQKRRGGFGRKNKNIEPLVGRSTSTVLVQAYHDRVKCYKAIWDNKRELGECSTLLSYILEYPLNTYRALLYIEEYIYIALFVFNFCCEVGSYGLAHPNERCSSPSVPWLRRTAAAARGQIKTYSRGIASDSNDLSSADHYYTTRISAVYKEPNAMV